MLGSFDYLDLGGGVNRGVSADRIPSRQCAELINFYPYGTHLKRRGGHHIIARIDTSGFTGGAITGMVAYSPEIGSWLLLLGGATQFARLDGSTITALPITGETSIPSVGGPYLWSSVQYKKYTYWLRKAISGRFYRVNATRAARAGIAAPTQAPTIATSATPGVITAGDYRVVYTNYNAATALESNPSPVSNTLAHPGAFAIDYSTIAVPTDPFVTSRRLYRTIPNQVGVYFFVAEITGMITTTYNAENVAVADMGRPVSFNNGLPPDNLYVGEIWNERLFASDGVDVWFSEFLLPECFGVESSISVYPDDGHKVTALRAFGDRLIIGKTNAIHYLTGTDARNFALATLTDRHGCASQASMQAAEGNLFWLGMDKAVYRSDGTAVKKISDPEVTAYLEAISDADMERVCAGVIAEKNWYVLNFGLLPNGAKFDNVSGQHELLVYNYKENTWSLFNNGNNEGVFRYITSFFDENGAHRLYGVGADSVAADEGIFNIAQDGYSYDDALSAIQVSAPRMVVASALLKSEDFGLPGRRKSVRAVGYLADYTRLPNQVGLPDQVTMEVFGEGDTSAPLVSRVLNMDDGGNQHRLIAAGIVERLQTRFQVKLTFQTTCELLLKEVKFQIAASKRLTGQPQ